MKTPQTNQRNNEKTGTYSGRLSGRMFKKLAKVSAGARVYVVDADLRGTIYVGKAGELKTAFASNLTQRPNRKRAKKRAK